MLNTQNQEAILRVKHFLDEMLYCFVDYRFLSANSFIFPEFGKLQETFKYFSKQFRLIFSLLRQGHSADEGVLRKILPIEFLDALITTGLLFQTTGGAWRTPGLAVLPIDGLYIVVSLPPSYPTHSMSQAVYFGPDSMWLRSALPANLTGREVVDVCSGSGIQGLLCALRGAEQVVCLEMCQRAVTVAQFNIIINGLIKNVEVRKSDIFSALERDELFDYFVANPPFIPNVKSLSFSTVRESSKITLTLIENFADHLNLAAEGVFYFCSLGDQYSINFNREHLVSLCQNRELFMRAYVISKIPFFDYLHSLDKSLEFIQPETSDQIRKQELTSWQRSLKKNGVKCDYVYEQIVRFWKTRPKSFVNLPIYDPIMSDPLLSRTVKAKHYA